MEDISYWIDRARTAEANLNTLKENVGPAIERVKAFKGNFGVRERDTGEIVIDYEKFVERLGLEGAMELRKVIDELYRVTGAPGEKPHVRLASGG